MKNVVKKILYYVLSVMIVVGILPLTNALADSAVTTPTQTITNGAFTNQTVTYDTNGNRVDAHDGHIYFFAGKYYWYGTSYQCGFAYNISTSNYCGVKIYESTDLTHWQYDGFALNPSTNQAYWNSNCGGSTFGCYRPKVAYNAATGKYVMWVNQSMGTMGPGYIVLTSSTPNGTFTFQSHQTMTYNRCLTPGNLSFGDEDLFVDTDGTAYLAYTSISNSSCAGYDSLSDHNIAIEKLNSTYTASAGTYTVFNRPGEAIEAPAMFKRGNTYYMLYSSPACPYCNTAGTSYATSSSAVGPYTYRGNITPWQLGGQPSGVTPIAANGSVEYLFTLDRWNQVGSSWSNTNQYNANYFFAPLSFGTDGSILPIPALPSWQARVQAIPAPTPALPSTIVSSDYNPLPSPQRILDTRLGFGALSPSHGAYKFAVPASMRGAKAIAVNVTAIAASTDGYLQIWGDGGVPSTSNLNFSTSRPVVPNLAIVKPAADGTVSLLTAGSSVDVVLDVQGIYPATSSYTTLTTPQRILDTRYSAQIPAFGYIDYPLTAGGYVPATAKYLTANLTVLSSTYGNIQAYDPSLPHSGETANVTHGAGATANLSLLPMPANGIMRFYNSSPAPANLIVDVQGYDMGTTTALLPIPKRLGFSMTGQGYYSLPFASYETYQYDATNVGVPATARAVIVEFSTTPTTYGYLTAFADNAGVPNTSILNFAQNIDQSNLAIVPISNGMFDVYMDGTAGNHVAVDIIGYIK